MRTLNSTAKPNTDPSLFYLQGNFMATFEDHYSEYVPLFDSQPTYEVLSNKQLRYYFTWRTMVRTGNPASTGIYYIYLYFFELINNIGVNSNVEALEKMAFLINSYKSIFPENIFLFSNWFRDYYAMNNIETPFPEIVCKLGLAEIFPHGECEYASILQIVNWNFISNPFISSFGAVKFVKCFDIVLKNLKVLFSMYGIDIRNLFEGRFVSDNSWFPYEQAIFYNAQPPTDRVVYLSKFEQFVCVKGVWNRRVLSCGPLCESVVNLIVRKTEAALNPSSDTNISIPANIYSTPYSAVISDGYFDEIIVSATREELSPECSSELLQPIRKLLLDSHSEIVSTIWRARAIPSASSTSVEAALRFVSQARILEDIIDCYESEEPIADISAVKYTYSLLSIAQTRQYITWRSKIKSNEEADANPYFAKIYANELINKIAAKTDLQVLEKLARLVKIVPDISDVFLDYFITHPGEMKFSELILRFDIVEFFPHIAIQNKSFKDWFRIFSDKLGFVPDVKISNLFNFCIQKLWGYIEDLGLAFMVLFLGVDNERRGNWSAFSQCIYVPDEILENKSVYISDYDSYDYNAVYRKWNCVSASAINKKAIYLVEYIMKRLTANLHKQKRPKIQEKRVKGMFPSSPAYSKYIAAILDKSFDNAIDYAFREHERIVVKVDCNLLEGVRKSADENLEKLIVNYEEIDERPDQETNLETNLQVSEIIEPENSWYLFYSNLSDIQCKAIDSLLNRKPNEIVALARLEGIMAEVLIDSINNVALEHIGDYIIEDTAEGPRIFEDYTNDLLLCSKH